jgi:hypothetical protein
MVHYRNDPELTDILDTIPKLADRFNITGMITLLGGEPFLYWNQRIVAIAQQCDKYFPGTLINIFTNGQLLAKNINKVLDLAGKIKNFSLTITDHFNGLSQPRSKAIENWQHSLDEFLSNEKIVKIHAHHYHIKNNTQANIYIAEPDNRNWRSIYKHTVTGKIKPFATNDPQASMKHGCVSNNICSMLNGTKLYKCTQLATLRDAVTQNNQLEDPDWQKYLAYNPVDFANLDEDSLTFFESTYGSAIDVCDMCSNNPNSGNARTLDMILRKV